MVEKCSRLSKHITHISRKSASKSSNLIKNDPLGLQRSILEVVLETNGAQVCQK